MKKKELTEIKALLLSIGFIAIDETYSKYLMEQGKVVSDFLFVDNHHYEKWIFIKISPTNRVRLIQTETSHIKLKYSCVDGVYIYDEINDSIIIDNLNIEKAMVHCPEQLYLGLYETCSYGCSYCPLTLNKTIVKYDYDSMIREIDQFDINDIKGVCITSAIPPYMTSKQVNDELFKIMLILSTYLGPEIPLGVCTRFCDKDTLKMFHDLGVSEFRINLETINVDLANRISPKKDVNQILKSLEDAVTVFGIGKVSSNLLLEIGETDEDVESAVQRLCSIGVIPTLSPYDIVRQKHKSLERLAGKKLERVSQQRLISLAQMHKESMNAHRLLKNTLRTMCPACTGSHIMPGIDI